MISTWTPRAPTKPETVLSWPNSPRSHWLKHVARRRWPFSPSNEAGKEKKPVILCDFYVSTMFQLFFNCLVYMLVSRDSYSLGFFMFFSSKAIGCAQWSTTMGVADSGGFSGCRTDRPDKTGPPDGDVAVSCCQLILSWLGFLTCFDLVLTNLIVGFASVVAPFFLHS